MTSVCQKAEKDGILMLLQDPYQDRQLNSMASWELEGLSFGIHQLEKLFRGDSKLFLGLRNLDLSVKFAQDYACLMYGIDRLLDQHPIRIITNYI